MKAILTFLALCHPNDDSEGVEALSAPGMAKMVRAGMPGAPTLGNVGKLTPPIALGDTCPASKVEVCSVRIRGKAPNPVPFMSVNDRQLASVQPPKPTPLSTSTRSARAIVVEAMPNMHSTDKSRFFMELPLRFEFPLRELYLLS